jgi:hypothetical protein
MKKQMKLTEAAIRAVAFCVKPYKLSDGDGMYLLVNPTGSRLWRFKYRIEKREKLLALGAYPEVSLKAARERLFNARKFLANGIEPISVMAAAKAVLMKESA